MKALVIGGNGPTGHLIVNGLIRRGYQVVMLHTGSTKWMSYRPRSNTFTPTRFPKTR